MTEKLIDFETAKLANEKGFNYMKANVYGDNMAYDKEGSLIQAGTTLNYILAPTQALLQKWIRETHKLHIWLRYDENGYFTYINNIEYVGWYEVYEEALEQGLLTALNLIK